MEQLGVVDTSVIISFLRGQDPGASCFQSLLKSNRVIVSSISVFELRLGEVIDRSPSLDDLFDVVDVSHVDSAVATTAARIFQELEVQGSRIGLRDTFIAATTLEEGVPVYTHNIDHFKRIEELKVLTPSME